MNLVARMTKVLYQDQREENSPKSNADDFINLIERKDPGIQEFLIFYITQ